MTEVNFKTQELALKCLPTAHPSIQEYVKELEAEVTALRKQMRTAIGTALVDQDRLEYACSRARELEIEHDCETDDWGEAGNWSSWHSWPSQEAKAEIEKRIARIQIGLAAAIREGPNPDPKAPF